MMEPVDQHIDSPIKWYETNDDGFDKPHLFLWHVSGVVDRSTGSWCLVHGEANHDTQLCHDWKEVEATKAKEKME